MAEIQAAGSASAPSIRSAMELLAHEDDPGRLMAEGNAFVRRFPPAEAMGVAAAIGYANPFFLPDIPAEFVPRVALGLDGFGEMVMRAKLTAARAQTLNVLIAAPAMDEADILAEILSTALKLPKANLAAATFDAASFVSLGGAAKEAEIDEYALLRASLTGAGFVGSQAVRANPFSASLLALYGVRPIVLSRRLPDLFVAMDRMILDRRARGSAAQFGARFADGLPEGHEHRPIGERLETLVARHLPWLVQFHVSWAKIARSGVVRPLFLSYEADILGDKGLLAARLADHLALPIDAEDMLAHVTHEFLPGLADRERAEDAATLIGPDLMDDIAFHVGAFAGEEDLAFLMPH